MFGHFTGLLTFSGIGALLNWRTKFPFASKIASSIGWDGTALRVLGLDVLHWKGLDGSLLNVRIAGVGDHSRLRLSREEIGRAHV